MQRSGAAAVIIGNEVLTAKVDEQNGALLIRRLRACGVPLRSVAIVPDEIDAIVEAVTQARRRARYVFTSGGIGPTHDDVTVRAVALAMGRRVVRDASIEAAIRKHYGDTIAPEALRLAEVPEGATLIAQGHTWYPVISCDDVFLLPGVPQLFRLQLETVLARLEQGKVHLYCLFLDRAESEIARALDLVALGMPQVAIGSYPEFDRAASYRVKITIEAADDATVAEAVGRLRRELPSGSIVREE